MLLQEFRQGARALMRVPSLTAISVVTVSLGVGAGTSLFSVVKAVLLNPLPYPESDRVAWVAEVNDHGRQTQVAYRNFLDWREQNHSFANLAAYADFPVTVSGGETPQRVRIALVGDDFFTVLRVSAQIGRTFSAGEWKQGSSPTAVIGYGLWQRAFGGDPKIIGSTLRVGGIAPTIIGIMPAETAFPEKTELWLPITTFGDPGINVRTGHNWRVIGRLKPDASIEQAQTDISAIERRIKREHPSAFQAKDAAAMLLQSHVVGEVRTALLMLFGAVGFLLLIVCVNVANLLLVRVTARSRELAIRTALGAGRRRLIRQMVSESLLLALAGGAGGLLLAVWSMDLLRILLPASVPRVEDIRVDGAVIAFALAVSTAAGLLLGAIPAWRACATNVNEALKSGSRSATATRQSHRTQGALVISEVCLSLVLVAGAGLLARSFWRLHTIDPGFRPDHVLAVNAGFGKEDTVAKTSLAYSDLLGRVRALPGVAAAGTGSNIPIDGFHPDGHFFIDGRREETRNADAGYVIVSPGYLGTMRIPLVRGRDFSDQDSGNSVPVAIISQEMARRFFPNADPIGKRIWFDSFTDSEHWLTIVGIAGDVREDSLTQKSTYAQAYTLYSQQQKPGLLEDGMLVVRTLADPAMLAGAVRNAVRAVNRDSAPTVRTMQVVMDESLGRQRFQMQVLGGFALLALLLAAVGLYGVLSYMVTANRAQIGIRLALGAPPASVFRWITARALALAGIGVILGALGCLAVRSVLAVLLFGIGPNDPATIAGAIAVLFAVTLAAAFFPARRAMHTDPMVALREE